MQSYTPYQQSLKLFESWNNLYNISGMKAFVDFFNTPQIQNELLPVKIVFAFFTIFFLCAIMYFYVKSSYIYYHFLQGFPEFLSRQGGLSRDLDKRWKNIIKRAKSGAEGDYKFSIIEADQLLLEVLESKNYKGKSFEEKIANVGKKILANPEDIVKAHEVRDSIVHDADYKLDLEQARKMLSDYEVAIKKVSLY